MTRPPRRPAVRKRPQAASVVDHSNQSSPVERKTTTAQDGVDRDRVLQEFEAALQANHELDAGERDEVLRRYRDAMESTPIELAPPDLEKLQADFKDTIRRLVDMGVVDVSETSDLTREFSESLEPLRDPAFIRSQEYLRRVREDGADAATQWLQEQQTTYNAPEEQFRPAISTSKSAPRRRRRV